MAINQYLTNRIISKSFDIGLKLVNFACRLVWVQTIRSTIVMTNIVNNADRTDALAVINFEKKGLVKELIAKIGERIFNEFLSIGFIICGYNAESKTWRISQLGEDYYAELQ